MNEEPSPGATNAPSQLGRIRFVLVEPQFGGNIGQAARALMNLGFSRLVLVATAADPLGREARMMAVEAAGLLESAECHEDLDSALAGAATVVGMSRRVGKHRRPHSRFDESVPDLLRLLRAGELAVVFGREDHGLPDAALDRCTHLAYLLSAPTYPSFNLAKAVLLAAYELRRALPAVQDGFAEPLADHAAREAMYGHLERAFGAIGFFSRDTLTPMMRRLRRMLGRAELTDAEVQILRGIARQTLWAAGRTGQAEPARAVEDSQIPTDDAGRRD